MSPARVLRVAVVGAGPAGSAAAITLSRAGVDVTLIDKAVFPRDKCCGDGLTTAALRNLEELGFDPRRLPSWRNVTNTAWRTPSGHEVRLTVPRDGVRLGIAKRFELDAGLLEIARASGARTLEGHTVQECHVLDDGMRLVATELDPIDCDYVIAADGMWSPLRRMLGTSTRGYLGDMHAFRQYFRNVEGTGKDRFWVSLERELLPGYLWSFPLANGEVNIGFGVHRRTGQSVQWMKSKWPELLQRPHVRQVLGEAAEPVTPVKAWPLPSSMNMRLLTAAGGRALFVGDAARVIDPFSGEGIAQALETGRLAAQCVLGERRNSPAEVGRRYKRTLATGLRIDNFLAHLVARLVTNERAAESVVRLSPRGPMKGRYALRWVLEDHPRAAPLTPWRWNQMLDQQGAFQ